jgi:hypothetical protein
LHKALSLSLSGLVVEWQRNFALAQLLVELELVELELLLEVLSCLISISFFLLQFFYGFSASA